MRQAYNKIATRMLLTALAVALIPLYLIGGAIYFYYTFLHQEKIKEELMTLAANRAGAIELFLAERTTLLEVLTRSQKMEDLVVPGALDKMFTLLNQRSWSFVDLGVIDSSGEQVAYVGPYPLQHKDYAKAQWFQETMLRGVYVSDVFLGFRGVPHFVVAVKRNQNGGAWILRATIDSEVFNRLVLGVQLRQQGDAYIVNAQGVYQTPPRFGGKLLSPSEINLQAAPRTISVEPRQARDGRELLSAYVWLSPKNWLLVIEEDPDEAMGPMSLARDLEVVILLLGTILVAAAVAFLVRIMIGQLQSQDRERAALDAQLAHSARLVSLGRLATGIAHEINNPLAIISENAGLLEDLMDAEFLASHPDGELFQKTLKTIQDSVFRAREVTHRMLGFGQRMAPKLTDLSVNEVLREAFSFLEKEAALNNVRVLFNLDESLPRIRSDTSQLQQVFLNLLQNALDAVTKDGEIALTSHLVDDYVEVTVTDTGPGIPPELQDRVFDPFYTTKDPGKGTGLGLSISHSIMQKLGGALSLASQPGHGCTFTVKIPKSMG
ncbi:MAG: two-component sensor histidine kinase [Deltaproteobacteria bacterium]|nr:two-component sensor histidine kinase [Deltaproteobacteria bacterium]